MWRRSNALLGRRENFFGDKGRIVTRRLGRATTVATGLGARFEGLASATSFDCGAKLIDVRFKAASESGCNDLGRSAPPRGDIFGLTAFFGGVMFSLLFQVLLAVLTTVPRTLAPLVVGKGRKLVEYIICDPDGVSGIFDDDPTLLVGELDSCERVELLLLERLPVTRNGKRSFIRAEVGVPSGSCVEVGELLSVDDERSLKTTGVEFGADGSLYLSGGRSDNDVFEPSAILNTSSGTDLTKCDSVSGLAGWKTSTSVSRVVLFPGPARGVKASRDSRTITVASSESVCEVRIV